MTVAELIRKLQRCAQDVDVRFVSYNDEYSDIDNVSEVKQIGNDKDGDFTIVELR